MEARTPGRSSKSTLLFKMTSYTKATMNNIAMCMPSRVLSTPLPGRTPSLKSSLPCLAFSHDSSQSRLVLSGGSRILSLPLGSAGSPGPVVAPRLLVRLGRGLRLPWLLGRPLRCLALPRVPGSTENAPPIHVFGVCRMPVWPRLGYTASTGAWGSALLGWRFGRR